MNSDATVFQQIVDAVRQRHRFVVSSHSRPDGDSIGAQLAFASALVVEANHRLALGRHHRADRRWRIERLRQIGRREERAAAYRDQAEGGDHERARRNPRRPLDRHAIVEDAEQAEAAYHASPISRMRAEAPSR